MRWRGFSKLSAASGSSRTTAGATGVARWLLPSEMTTRVCSTSSVTLRGSDRFSHCLRGPGAGRRRCGRSPAGSNAERWPAPYFGGFFTGEGCFGLTDRRARITVKLRRDDRALLGLFASAFEIGSVCDIAPSQTANPAAAWIVTSRRDLARVVDLLDAAELRGRKLRQYLAWRPAALALARLAAGAGSFDAHILTDSRRRLASASEYRAPADRVDLPSASRADMAREAYLDILRAWVRETHGSLTCTAYERARRRHPHWPNRDTIARMFGSWGDAMAAAVGQPGQPLHRSM